MQWQETQNISLKFLSPSLPLLSLSLVFTNKDLGDIMRES